VRAGQVGPQCVFGFPRIEQHLLMVAHQRHDMAPLLKSNHLLKHFPALWPAIDVIAQKDERVLGLGLHVLK
jgi:fibrillarin-like rRNA methylase